MWAGSWRKKIVYSIRIYVFGWKCKWVNFSNLNLMKDWTSLFKKGGWGKFKPEKRSQLHTNLPVSPSVGFGQCITDRARGLAGAMLSGRILSQQVGYSWIRLHTQQALCIRQSVGRQLWECIWQSVSRQLWELREAKKDCKEVIYFGMKREVKILDGFEGWRTFLQSISYIRNHKQD